VNNESIARLRARNARHDEMLGVSQSDPESGRIEPSGVRKFLAKLMMPFSKNFWINFFESSEGDILVDSAAVSWAYLEAGVIECIGCLVAFFVVLWDARSPTTGIPFRISPYDAKFMAQNKFFLDNNAKTYTTVSGNVLVTYV